MHDAKSSWWISHFEFLVSHMIVLKILNLKPCNQKYVTATKLIKITIQDSEGGACLTNVQATLQLTLVEEWFLDSWVR